MFVKLFSAIEALIPRPAVAVLATLPRHGCMPSAFCAHTCVIYPAPLQVAWPLHLPAMTMLPANAYDGTPLPCRPQRTPSSSLLLRPSPTMARPRPSRAMQPRSRAATPPQPSTAAPPARTAHPRLHMARQLPHPARRTAQPPAPAMELRQQAPGTAPQYPAPGTARLHRARATAEPRQQATQAPRQATACRPRAATELLPGRSVKASFRCASGCELLHALVHMPAHHRGVLRSLHTARSMFLLLVVVAWHAHLHGLLCMCACMCAYLAFLGVPEQWTPCTLVAELHILDVSLL